MILRALLALALAVAGLLLAACGPQAATEEKICGPRGCDGCLGLACGGAADAGVR